MNVLVLGSGGREHTLAWKISQSPDCNSLFVAPGNAGTPSVAKNIALSLNDFEGISSFIKENKVDLLVIGPEDPLVKGLRDYIETQNIQVGIIGPGKKGAQLEGSKGFSKLFMERHSIPTARYQTFTKETIEDAISYLQKMPPPIVLKADGLAAGKGVIISPDHESAETSLKEMLINEQFGAASSRVVIEEFLEGIEVSVFVLTDGKNYKILPEAKDYKRIGDGDTGPNTGGMGAISPVHFADVAFMNKVEERVIKPTISGLQKDGIDYCGFIFIGLMNMGGEPYVIEYNVRMGDPETQAVVPRITSDFLALLMAASDGKIDEYELSIDSAFATTVVMVSGGYPGNYVKGKEISGIENVSNLLFHAGTSLSGNKILTNGGRVLAITGRGETIEKALSSAYDDVSKVNWDKVNFRKDIGRDLLQ